MKTLIIGGVAGGASVAARLRRLDEHAEIIILERGEYISFANCGLPYYIGDVITKKEYLVLQTPQSFDARFRVEVRVFSEAVAIHPAEKTVTVKNLRTGESYEESYDKLVLSPGAEPIRPASVPEDSERIFTLRNIPDTYKIKDYITSHSCKSALVIGGGYIGLEMIENLRRTGMDVTLLQRSEQVLRSTVKGYETVTVKRRRLASLEGKVLYALLPVWLFETVYGGRKYQFAINGQTGKMVGELPVDKGAFWKYLCGFTAIGTVVCSVVGILLFGGVL